MILELFYLTVIVCFIVDVSGIVDTVKHTLFVMLKGRNIPYREFSLKPFDCSLCSTWWLGIIYLIFFGEFGLQNILFVSLYAYGAEIISNTMIRVRDMVNYLIEKI